RSRATSGGSTASWALRRAWSWPGTSSARAWPSQSERATRAVGERLRAGADGVDRERLRVRGAVVHERLPAADDGAGRVDGDEGRGAVRQHAAADRQAAVADRGATRLGRRETVDLRGRHDVDVRELAADDPRLDVHVGHAPVVSVDPPTLAGLQ